jgi:hypothetical protein
MADTRTLHQSSLAAGWGGHLCHSHWESHPRLLELCTCRNLERNPLSTRQQWQQVCQRLARRHSPCQYARTAARAGTPSADWGCPQHASPCSINVAHQLTVAIVCRCRPCRSRRLARSTITAGERLICCASLRVLTDVADRAVRASSPGDADWREQDNSVHAYYCPHFRLEGDESRASWSTATWTGTEARPH